MSDSSEIATLRQEIEVLQARLDESAAELQSFIFTVSHDFKAPLRAIMSVSMILTEDYESVLDRTAKNELKRQSDAARNLNRMLEALLKLSRLNRAELHRVEFDAGALFKAVAAQSGLDDSHAATEGELTVVADREMVITLLTNLVENSLKFAKSVTPPHLVFGRDERGFFLKDDGIGFEPENAERIFLPFDRLNGDQYPGLGMGLTTCKRVVSRHGGKISAEAKPGEGTKILFTLPCTG